MSNRESRGPEPMSLTSEQIAQTRKDIAELKRLIKEGQIKTWQDTGKTHFFGSLGGVHEQLKMLGHSPGGSTIMSELEDVLKEVEGAVKEGAVKESIPVVEVKKVE